MNKKLALLTIILSLLTFKTDADDFMPFSKQALIQMKSQNLGKPWLMILWSVDCPPCYKELALLQKLYAKHRLHPVVIINTDDSTEYDQQRQDVINRFQLNKLRHFYFLEGRADKERYVIDPDWFGELPRSYFVDADGKFHGKSGLLSEQLLKKWILVN